MGLESPMLGKSKESPSFKIPWLNPQIAANGVEMSGAAVERGVKV